MKTISKPGDNLGGLIKLWAIPKAVVSVLGRTVSVSSSADVYEIYCTPGSMSLAEPHQRDERGVHYNAEFLGFVPRDSETVRNAIEDMETKPYAVLFQDGNGEFKLSGSNTEPLRFSAVLTTGIDTQERAGYQIRFAGTTTRRAVFVNNPFA
jgi:hypothetical protein